MEVIEGKEFHFITEETAKELTKKIDEMSKSIACFSANEICSYVRRILEISKEISEKKVKFYTQKVETSCFIIRWWYKRKLQKAKDELKDINDTIKEHNANRRSNQSPA